MDTGRFSRGDLHDLPHPGSGRPRGQEFAELGEGHGITRGNDLDATVKQVAYGTRKS